MSSFISSKHFWLTLVKLAALVFVGGMAVLQIPEIRYDFQPLEPVPIHGPDELTRERVGRATFAMVYGTADFDKAFIFHRYGLNYTYFNIEPYGMKLVVRTYEKVNDDWRDLNRFVGKLRPFKGQPFSYSVRHIYEERMHQEIPEDAYFLALDDAPKPDYWQISAAVFAALMWLVMVYMFFIHKWAKERH